jgi:actin-related protein
MENIPEAPIIDFPEKIIKKKEKKIIEQNEEIGENYQKVLVIDNGSFYTKTGFAGILF